MNSSALSKNRIKSFEEDLSNEPVYVYDGTLEGLLTAIYQAYCRRENPLAIQTKDAAQPSLFCECYEVHTSNELADRVAKTLKEKLGKDEFERVKIASLSDEVEKETVIFRYVKLALASNKYIWCDHSNPIVAKFEKTWRYVYTERHNMIQFLRFSKMEGGIYFAKINPNANVVPIMMDHFSKRFNTQPFMIYDEVHHIAGMSSQGQWSLVNTDTITIPNYHSEELKYQQMWRMFYDTICNEERINPRLRMSFMPKRLWNNICEMQDLISD